MEMIITPINPKAYNLLHEGTLALMEIEEQGIHVDVKYCKKMRRRLSIKIDMLEKKFEHFKEGKLWIKQYGNKTKWGSDDQLRWLLFKKLKIEAPKGTSVDAEALKQIGIPFTDHITKLKQLKKTRNNYLGNIIREQVSGVLHCFYNLHLAITYRSSCNNINFTNIPIRIKEIAKIIRPAFIPRPGHRLGGLDYKGIEVGVACCYHKDPNMFKYIKSDPGRMHFDTAMDLFMLKAKEVSDDARFIAKNNFVFAEFYGDYYVSTANALWIAMEMLDVETNSGQPLREYLRDQGIKTYKKFEDHVKDVEDKFWNERFPVYRDWKDEIVAQYEKDGYYDTLTGFRIQGVLDRNKIINYPIQGSAFHCLLWSIPKIHNFLKSNKLRSKLVGQIHDEATGDFHGDEFDYVLGVAQDIMCRQLKEEWDWIKVPLEIDAEFGEVDENWSKKKKVPIITLKEKVKF